MIIGTIIGFPLGFIIGAICVAVFTMDDITVLTAIADAASKYCKETAGMEITDAGATLRELVRERESEY